MGRYPLRLFMWNTVVLVDCQNVIGLFPHFLLKTTAKLNNWVKEQHKAFFQGGRN